MASSVVREIKFSRLSETPAKHPILSDRDWRGLFFFFLQALRFFKKCDTNRRPLYILTLYHISNVASPTLFPTSSPLIKNLFPRFASGMPSWVGFVGGGGGVVNRVSLTYTPPTLPSLPKACPLFPCRFRFPPAPLRVRDRSARASFGGLVKRSSRRSDEKGCKHLAAIISSGLARLPVDVFPSRGFLFCRVLCRNARPAEPDLPELTSTL